MIESPTLSELVRVVLILGGLWLSLAALRDDLADLGHVRRCGEIGGPRWIAATEHLWFNGTLLVGWLCMVVVIAIAIYLPARQDPVGNELATIAGWLSLAYSTSVLIAQVHRRVGRVKLRNVPLAEWERMLTSMMDGLTQAERQSVSARLLASTTAGREMGHLIRNETAVPVGLIETVLASADLTTPQRDYLSEARDRIVSLAERSAELHAEIKRQGEAP